MASMTSMTQELLLRLHLAVGGDAARAVVRSFVDGLSGDSAALRDRAAASGDAVDAIDDAITWTLTRIAGPTLLRDSDGDSADVDVLIDARARIVLGDLRGVAHESGLTASEAARWAESSTPNAATWLLERAGISDANTDYIAVARWAVRMSGSATRADALRTRRVMNSVEGSALDRLGELRPSDLSDSVSDTLDAATRRIVAELWDGPDELAAVAAWERRLPDGARRIRRFSDLHAEGSEMRHCVGLDISYAEGVRDGRHEILSLRSGDQRATALVAHGRVVECRSFGNQVPSAALMRLAEQCARMIDR